MTKNNKFITLKVLRDLIKQVDDFLETKKGQRFTGRPAFIQHAINELLKEFENNKH